jgi:predicted CXXCH cytochrome family protein
MKFVSERTTAMVCRRWLRTACWLFLAGLCVSIGACATLRPGAKPVKENRGVLFSHAKHVERGLEDCSLCHDPVAEEWALLSQPGHDICSACHEIPAEPEDKTGCDLCHPRPDYTVAPYRRMLSEETIFKHAPHVDAQLECAQCHKDVDAVRVSALAFMAECMDCHAKGNAKLNECAVCHKELRREVAPQFLEGRRVAHDSPPMWERIHGREARRQTEACEICHEVPQDCDDCHAKTAPNDHTVSWRRKTHGLHADWDRNRCAVCHEEDSCVRCHRNTTPSSHRAGWGHPRNRHCVTCHYPPSDTKCTVCHERIEHESAMPSIHNRGIIPGQCGFCHPLGLPHKAPHLMNSTTACVMCHP